MPIQSTPLFLLVPHGKSYREISLLNTKLMLNTHFILRERTSYSLVIMYGQMCFSHLRIKTKSI